MNFINCNGIYSKRQHSDKHSQGAIIFTLFRVVKNRIIYIDRIRYMNIIVYFRFRKIT